MKLNKRTLFLAGFAVIYIISYLFFYPQSFLISDEQIYAQQAYNLAHLKLRETNLGNAGLFLVMDDPCCSG